ncbi:Inherit from opiNOG: protein Hydra magnipapillata [Seminavis robusta]|uniref:Inherit from opiNOG: protein Hydra magnipapillata n=1 Tax=Seminavis robusta TaxID=568900 RepID=A0A9N8ELN0_9STRA|nr:Inherit from opiNOG: protein Hydra magnipapillata [Seminavis robusta]|eukprot:Sro1205_g252280.1 Inherit from opiNOG: protein Hydra magnipapillata (437) ;mRNA; f:18982-20644
MPRGHQGRLRKAKAFAKKLLRELRSDALPPPNITGNQEPNENVSEVQVREIPAVASANQDNEESNDHENHDGRPKKRRKKPFVRSQRFSRRGKKERDVWKEKVSGVPTLKELGSIINDEDAAIRYLGSKGAIKIPTVCGRCNSAVKPDWKRHQSRCQKANCIWTAPKQCEICPGDDMRTVPLPPRLSTAQERDSAPAVSVANERDTQDGLQHAGMGQRNSNQVAQVDRQFTLTCGKGYLSLERLGYDHKTLCHKYEFVSAEGTHTQTIEGNWTPLKRAIPVQCRSGVDLQEYLFQFMWRRKNEGNEWEALWDGLARVQLTMQELERMDEERERVCEDEDDDYAPIDDAQQDEKLEAEADNDNDFDDLVGLFGDMDLTPVSEGGLLVETTANDNTTAEDDEERLHEDLAYEVIGEMLAGGEIDRSIFFHEGQLRANI